MSGVSAILLAAGAGSRFGGGKLLAPYRGSPLIEAPLSNLAGAPVDETVVVVGESAGALREACRPYDVRVVENHEWAQGQSTSVRAGLLSLGPEARAAVVLLADQPLVGAGSCATRRSSPGSSGRCSGARCRGTGGRGPCSRATRNWLRRCLAMT